MIHQILIVLTSTATMGRDGEPTGLWLEEFTVPYYAFHDAGYRVDVVSIAGGAVPLDPRSLGGANADLVENKRFRDDVELQKTMRSTRSVGQVRFDDYSALFLPGGHGTMWDLPYSLPRARGVADLFLAGRLIAAVCHGPAGLLGVRLPSGVPLVAGRWVAAFTVAEEEAVGLKAKVPFLLDEALVGQGARLVKGEPFVPMVVGQDTLVTGQNPQSARETSGIIIAALRERMPAMRAAI